MYACFSSGVSPRYREDVLRVLALPRGTRLQFRYDLRWISSQARRTLDSSVTLPADALIIYVDQNDKSNPPTFVPIRFAKIVEVLAHGTTASLVLEVGDFAHATDVGAFNQELRTSSPEQAPSWDSEGKITGHYWLDIGHPPKVERSGAPRKAIKLWEQLVSTLFAFEDFRNEPIFYSVDGLYEVGSHLPIEFSGGIAQLKNAREYECRIYHYHPTRAQTPAAVLKLDIGPSAGSFTSNALLEADSRYDLKRARFRTVDVARSLTSYISVLRQGRADWHVDIDMPILVRGGFWKTLGFGISLGAALSVPQVVATWSNPQLPRANQELISAVAAVAGLIAGIYVAFGVRKPV